MTSSTNLLDPDLTDVPLSHLQRWRLIKDIHSHFWRRWKNEYLQSLQQRTKWITSKTDLQINTLVMIQQPTPSLQWKIGRILELHPGPDGITRVVTIQTPNGILKRPTYLYHSNECWNVNYSFLKFFLLFFIVFKMYIIVLSLLSFVFFS